MLQLKHWQLFLFMVLPAVIPIPSPLRGVVHLVSLTLYFLWIYAIIHEGQPKLKQYQLPLLKEGRVKWHLRVLFVFVLLSILMPESSVKQELGFLDGLLNGILLVPSLLLFLYIFYAFFYVLISTAVMLARLEYRQDADFADYLTNTLMLMVLFGGIWFVQPRLNREFAEPPIRDVLTH